MQKPPYIFLNFQPDSLSSCHPLQASTDGQHGRCGGWPGRGQEATRGVLTPRLLFFHCHSPEVWHTCDSGPLNPCQWEVSTLGKEAQTRKEESWGGV